MFPAVIPSVMSNIDLLPRADLPVIWSDFKIRADAVWSVVDSLVVTDVSQKEAMALARKTRLTLREIRIAVEHKRVELGEGHLKEIQKVNGAAKAIREFIEPLEARLLVQESFAERAEALRLRELADLRNSELYALRPHVIIKDVGAMSEENYEALLATFRKEKEEIEAANRLRVEAERKLAEAQAEAFRVEQAVRAEAAKLMLAQQEEQKRLNDEAEQVRFEQEQKHRAELSAASAIRTLERQAAEQRRQEDLRIEREKTAVLEAELKAERAVKLAEEKRVMELAIAPDVEKLWEFAQSLRRIECPRLTTPCGISFSESLRDDLLTIAHDIEVTCKSWGLTTK